MFKFRHLQSRFLSRNISDTIPLEKSPRRHVIATLDPNKFAEKKQQRLHIGNQTSFILNISAKAGPAPHIFYDKTSKTDTRLYPSFPPDTKAFLYYFMSPEKPRIAGELRLRVTSSDDATSFESGSDLLRTDGQPWSRPLHVLSRYYFPLYEKLREDRLVPDDLDTALSTLPNLKISRGPIYSRSHHYTLNDTFIIDFSSTELCILAITEQGVERLQVSRIFSDGRGSDRGRVGEPYTGSALARFERSALIDHKGTRTVVLRFLKIITPVRCVIPLYDGYMCCPTEGELHRINRKCRPVWCVNIDKSKAAMIRGFKLLWNA